MVNSFVLLSEEKLSKNKKKKSKNSKKTTAQNREKKRGKSGTISTGGHRERYLGYVCVC